MAFTIAFTVFSASLFLCQFFVQTNAYAIDHSCKPYSTDHVDKTAMIQAAMAEANQMMTHAAATVVQDFPHSPDNSMQSCFPGASPEDRANIAGKYTTAANNVPWSLTNHNSLVADVLTIYCGDDNFTPDPSSGSTAWTDMTSFYTIWGPDHGSDPNAKLCQTQGIAMTLDSNSFTNPSQSGGDENIKMVVLCDAALVKGVSPDSTGSQPGVGAISALPGKAGFYPGKMLDNVAYTVCLSFTMLHELMHVTQSSSFFRGAAEVYSWDLSVALTHDYALWNIDNYAFYALAIFLPSDFFVFNGQIGSMTAFQAGNNAFHYQP